MARDLPRASRMNARILLAFALTTLACHSSAEKDDATEAPGDARGAAPADASVDSSGGLPLRNSWDPARADSGRRFLFDEWPGRAVLPKTALSYLWLVWGMGPVSEAEQWEQIERRYGLFREEGNPWPVGLAEADAQNLTFNCLLCHATRGVEPGEVWVGVGNARLDLERFYSDLEELAEVAEQYGIGNFELPYDLSGASQGPGAVDGVGLGMLFAGTIDELGETFGYQQAPAWWTLRYKERLYTDGAGRVDNWRTMMSTLFAFGMSQPEIQSYDAEFQDFRHYLLSLEPPPWPFEPPPTDSAEAGRGVFREHCSSCHGIYEGPEAKFPDAIVATDEAGTDPVRERGMDDFQVAAINTSWYGEPALWENTDGYLAPPLVGVWASAPYFHNGSVPTLAAVLDSSKRPASWSYAAELSYDSEAVGWRYEIAPSDETDFDTSRYGLDSGGHLYGDSLSQADRQVLLEYLKSL